ncbi:MAG: MFS transporter [Solirubrobacterales bacterium]|nr:MFS transporter [Solirubrobacterales bacterium]
MDGGTERIDRRSAVALVAMALAVFVVANDVTALSVALPDIESDFDADVGTVQWVISAYALIFGVLIVTGGRLADLLGRRRVFFVGAAIFAVFSLLGALAQDAWWLIVARALMGVGGALMWPAILGMTYEVLPASRAALAGGLILGAAGFGNAAGPLIGGALTDAFDWRAILVLNLPVAAAAALATWRFVPASQGEEGAGRFDYAGTATLSVGLIALLVALDEVTDASWTSPGILALLALCVALLAVFAVHERRAGDRALVPADVMASATFRSACLAVLLMSATFFVALMYLPQFMQKILGYSAMEAGLGLLPMMGTFALVSFVAGPLYERIGARPVLIGGAACLAAGPFLIAQIETGDSWAQLLPGMLVLGVGVGLFYSSITTAAVTALDPSRSSLAGGIVYMFQIAGGSIGLGVATAVFDAAADSRLRSELAAGGGPALDAGERDAVGGILAGTETGAQIQARFADAAARLEELAREAFAAGFRTSFLLVAALALAGLVVTVLAVRPRAYSADSEGESLPAASGGSSA